MPSIGPTRLWDAALGELQVQVPKPTFDTFLKGTVTLDVSDSHLVVGAANPFTAEYLEKRMSALIHRTVEGLAQRTLDVEFRVTHPILPAPPDRHTYDSDPATGPAGLPPRQERSDLLASYTFDSYVAGPTNELAYAAARAVAEAPGNRYNPLFLYSPVGLGKTHLLQAAALRLRERGCTALYQTCEQFTNAFIRAIREGAMPAFRQRYRYVDALLIDDIQFIAGKEQTQEGFFHLFNELYLAERQIVLSADQPPSALSFLGERLRSRFGAGLVADIQPPPPELCLAILRAKAQTLSAVVPDSVLEAIATVSPGNIRTMEGYLTRVVAIADLCAKPLTVDLVRQALGSIPKPPPADSLSPETALETIAAHFGLSSACLCGSRRDRHASLARRVAMHLLGKELHQPPGSIAQLLGGRHPSSVHQAFSQVDRQLAADPSFAADISALRQRIRVPAPAR